MTSEFEFISTSGICITVTVEHDHQYYFFSHFQQVQWKESHP